MATRENVRGLFGEPRLQRVTREVQAEEEEGARKGLLSRGVVTSQRRMRLASDQPPAPCPPTDSWRPTPAFFDPLARCWKVVTYNVATLRSSGRLHEILTQASVQGACMLLLQGTRWGSGTSQPPGQGQFDTVDATGTDWRIWHWDCNQRDPAAGVLIATRVSLASRHVVTTGLVSPARIGWIRLKAPHIDHVFVTA